METLVAVAHHRNQYYSGSRNGNSPMRCGLLPSRGLRDINCRGFESGIGLLPSPCKGYGSPLSNRGLLSPKPQTPCVGGKSSFGWSNGWESKSEDAKKPKKFLKSGPIAINLNGGSGSKKGRKLKENVPFSELWAGPAYSNSPPPSSLPMPKFEMKPKRTVSLDLPSFESELKLNLPPMAKSAPSSPTSKSSRSSSEFFSSDDESATKTLRRILNLDITDD